MAYPNRANVIVKLAIADNVAVDVVVNVVFVRVVVVVALGNDVVDVVKVMVEVVCGRRRQS